MGVTQQLPEKDKYIYKKEYMLDRLAVMMGGRAAEELVFETATSGAENDLKQVIQLSRKMVLDWGMSERFRHIAFGGRREQVFLGEQISQGREYSDHTARDVDGEIEKIIEMSYDRAVTTLREHRRELDEIADYLLEHEEMAGEAVLDILGLESEEAEAAHPEKQPVGRAHSDAGDGLRREDEPAGTPTDATMNGHRSDEEGAGLEQDRRR